MKALLQTPFPTEKIHQHHAALGFPDTPIHLRPVVAGGLLEDARAVLHAAALGVVGSEIDPADAGEGDGLGAHGAGLQGDVKVAGGQPGLPQCGGGAADGEDFRVSRGVCPVLGLVAGGGDDPPGGGIDDHRAHRHLVGLEGFLREREGLIHE